MTSFLPDFAYRQLLSYMDVMNAEKAGAFFCPASPKASTVGALLHAIRGVLQNRHSRLHGARKGFDHPLA